MPNTAITASPMNFSTLPPWRSIARRMASKYRAMICSSDSGSRPCPSSVDPTTSENTTVTVLRASASGADGPANAVPHARQNRASAWFSDPHAGQIVLTLPSFSGQRAARGKPRAEDGRGRDRQLTPIRKPDTGGAIQHR